MANSRLEKIGTIYTRTRGLIQSGALNYRDRPVWLDIYEAFPPKEEPRFDKPIPNLQIKQIFYEEDKIRVKLHKHLGRVGVVHLQNQKTQSFTQKFINTYKTLENQYGVGQEEPEKLFAEALDMLKREREAQLQADSRDENIDGALTSAFKNAAKQQKLQQQKGAESGTTTTSGVNIKDLFNE